MCIPRLSFKNKYRDFGQETNKSIWYRCKNRLETKFCEVSVHSRQRLPTSHVFFRRNRINTETQPCLNVIFPV